MKQRMIYGVPVSFDRTGGGRVYDALQICQALGDDQGDLIDRYVPEARMYPIKRKVNGEMRLFMNNNLTARLVRLVKNQSMEQFLKTKEAPAVEESMDQQAEDESLSAEDNSTKKYVYQIDQPIEVTKTYTVNNIDIYAIVLDDIIYLPTGSMTRAFFEERQSGYLKNIMYRQTRERIGETQKMFTKHPGSKAPKKANSYYPIDDYIVYAEKKQYKNGFKNFYEWLLRTQKDLEGAVSNKSVPIKAESNPGPGLTPAVVSNTSVETKTPNHVFTLEEIIHYDFYGTDVRVIIWDREWWFSAKDICDSLGYKNPTDAIKTHCKFPRRFLLETHVGVPSDSLDTPPTQKTTMNFITERDLYSLIFSSKIQKAGEFKDWVFEIVLPDLRQRGVFSIGNENNLNAIETLNTPSTALPEFYNDPSEFCTEQVIMNGLTYHVPLDPSLTDDPILKDLSFWNMRNRNELEIKKLKDENQRIIKQYSECHEKVSELSKENQKLKQNTPEFYTTSNIADWFDGVTSTEIFTLLIAYGWVKRVGSGEYELTNDALEYGDMKRKNFSNGSFKDYIGWNAAGVKKIVNLVKEAFGRPCLHGPFKDFSQKEVTA